MLRVFFPVISNVGYLCLIVLMILISTVHSVAQIIPDDRLIEWSPGLPDGTVEINSPVANVLDYGADTTGTTDSHSAIVDAINSLPPTGGVVFLPKGDYLIGSTIWVERDNIVFRGAGAGKTRLFMDFAGYSFATYIYARGDWQSIGSVSKGTKTITVVDGSKFVVGQFAEIQEENDSSIMYTKSDWNVPFGQNAVGQLFEVEAISGNQLTLKTPVHLDFLGKLNPKIRPQRFRKYVGFEDFYIEKTSGVESGKAFTFYFKNVAYCWIKGVESSYTVKSHVEFNTGLGCEISGNYFHNSFFHGKGGHGYGVRCGFHTTDVLVENNAFDSLRHSMMTAIGANGNVFGYNYSINNIQREIGETEFNKVWTPPDISNHGHYAYMNLFEGNDCREIGIGDFWGPAGPGNTYFRNKVNGDGINYYDHSDFQNILGNITTSIIDRDNNSTAKLEHGNKIDGTIFWDSSITDHNLPGSYYLRDKPDFFNDLDWPPFGPNIGKDNKLPAQLRIEGEWILPVLHELVSDCLLEDIIPPKATDPFGNIIDGTTTTTFPITVFDTTVVVWIFDNNIDTVRLFQTVIIRDEEAPVPNINHLADIKSECEIQSVSPPYATDNCAGLIQGVSNTSFPMTESTTILWSYEDDNNNITQQTQKVIIEPIDNTVSISGDTMIANETGFRYQWLDCNKEMSEMEGETNRRLIPKKSGSYAVRINSDSCLVISDCYDIVLSGLPFDREMEYGFYPNPACQYLYFDDNGGIDKINFYNCFGQNVLTLHDVESKIDISSLPKGVYFIEFEKKGYKELRKLILE